ncbi:MAG: hypothetical protein KJO35_10955, partial [Gammaproteobacteria bacterium]|nr:hypothetical protein [Gammaproteobacteria bacterium]
MAFRDLELDRYATLMRRLLPDASGFSICDAAGLRRWSSQCSDTDLCARAVAKLNDQATDWTRAKLLASTDLGEGVCAFYRRVDSNDEAAGSLLLVMSGDKPDASNIEENLAIIANVLAAENSFLFELDAMAAELSDRYEELNLIYITEDNVKYFDEGQDALRKLVQNTGRFLDAGMVALVMADRKVITSQ